jgi:hypothetical protein
MRLKWFVMMAIVGACGSDGTTDPDGILDPPPEGEGLQLALDVEIAPGEEIEYCQYLVLPDDGGAALDVTGFEHVYTSGSHHLLLYQTDLAAADVDDQMFPCAGASFEELGIRGVAYAAQVATGETRYPDDVALKMNAGDVVLLQTHYLNATDEPIVAEVRLNLYLAAEPAAIEAGTLFFYDWAIVVPPNQPSTARMSCGVPEDINLLFAMSHMHRRGVGYQSWLTGGELAEPEMLFTTTSWEGVEPRLFAPEMPVAAGQRIDYACDYMGEANAVVEGPSADQNEMCMFVAAYYPRLDAKVEQCRGPGSGPVFAGTQTCGETLGCVQGTSDEVANEQCLLDTCPLSADSTRDLMGCVFDHCNAVCADDNDPDCQPCVSAHCSGELDACLNATCG